VTRPAPPRDLAPNPLRLWPERCGLAVIDVQERLAAAMPEEPLRRHVGKMVLLVEAARRFGLPVLVTEQYPEGLGRTIPVLAEALKRVPAGHVHRFDKIDFDCSAVGAWRVALRASRRRQWIALGMETHVCVYQTVRSLVGMGLSVHVPADAVLSRQKSDWETGLRLVEASGAVVTSAETIVFDWLGRSGTEPFKKLQATIKRVSSRA
jgi:nicotinamidase-related amidase